MPTLKCPRCNARLRKFVTVDPAKPHSIVNGWECPDCHYDNVHSGHRPVPDRELPGT